MVIGSDQCMLYRYAAMKYEQNPWSTVLEDQSGHCLLDSANRMLQQLRCNKCSAYRSHNSSIHERVSGLCRSCILYRNCSHVVSNGLASGTMCPVLFATYATHLVVYVASTDPVVCHRAVSAMRNDVGCPCPNDYGSCNDVSMCRSRNDRPLMHD